MIGEVQNYRMYLPAEDPDKPNERAIAHPETNASQVLMDAGGTRLTDFLGPQVVISSDKPERPNTLWAAITSTRFE